MSAISNEFHTRQNTHDTIARREVDRVNSLVAVEHLVRSREEEVQLLRGRAYNEKYSRNQIYEFGTVFKQQLCC